MASGKAALPEQQSHSLGPSLRALDGIREVRGKTRGGRAERRAHPLALAGARDKQTEALACQQLIAATRSVTAIGTGARADDEIERAHDDRARGGKSRKITLPYRAHRTHR